LQKAILKILVVEKHFALVYKISRDKEKYNIEQEIQMMLGMAKTVCTCGMALVNGMIFLVK
jgi:hypothetical protein